MKLRGLFVTINPIPNVNDYWGYDSVARVQAAEGQTRRLFDYIAGYMTVRRLEQNYKNVCEQFPEETLLLFRKALDQYADANVGEKYYKHIASVLRRMREIPNGNAVVILSNEKIY